jgi:hypothetical protein
VQVQAAPTFLNIAGTALTATASGTGGLVTIDPYATNAVAQAGTSVRTIVDPANLFARENIAAQTGLANNPALIPAPTAGQSNWGTTLLGETVHYVPNIGWRVVANHYSEAFSPALDASVTASNIVRATKTAHRAGVVLCSFRVAAANNGSVGARTKSIISLNGANTYSSNSPGQPTNVNGDMSSAVSTSYAVVAGDVLTFVSYHELTVSGITSMRGTYTYTS